jgi:hypothetical protein
LHGFIGGERLGYHAGIDLAAGSTLRRAGFAYDVAGFPVGLAVRFGDTSFVSLSAGIGASGAVGTVDDALTFPVETIFEFGGGSVRLLGRARVTWVDAAPGRDAGAPSARFSGALQPDELDAMLGLRLGRHAEDFAPVGDGYFAAVAYREQLGARFVGLVIGYSIDMASPRRRPWHHGALPGCPECE